MTDISKSLENLSAFSMKLCGTGTISPLQSRFTNRVPNGYGKGERSTRKESALRY